MIEPEFIKENIKIKVLAVLYHAPNHTYALKSNPFKHVTFSVAELNCLAEVITNLEEDKLIVGGKCLKLTWEGKLYVASYYN